MNERDKPDVTIYTDGGADPNPGPGGWGVILIHNTSGASKELSGGEPRTTNNRMELTAAIKALEALKEPCQVDLYSDSSYVVQGMTRWVDDWAENDWKRGKKKKPLENDDLWKQLYALRKKHDIDWHWVKGHSGDEHNDRADELATREIRAFYDEMEGPDTADAEAWVVVSAQDDRGFWAASIRMDGEEDMIWGVEVEGVTSNRLYIIAAAEALNVLPDDSEVRIYTTSDYLRNGASRWIKGWKRRNWQTKKGDPVKNQTEWMWLDEQMSRLQVTWPDIKDDPTMTFAFEEVGRRAQEQIEMEMGSDRAWMDQRAEGGEGQAGQHEEDLDIDF